MNSVVVVGNGESRKSVDLNLIKTNHTLIGCNAIHRDIVVDHLICCDRRMAEEATKNPNSVDTYIYVRDDWYHYFRKIKKNKNVKPLPPLSYTGESRADQPIHWGSGCYAVLLASSLEFSRIYLLGFDLYPSDKKINNIYKDTQNYNKGTADPVDPSYWIYQLSKVFVNSKSDFIIVNTEHWKLPGQWKLPNVHFISLNEFLVDNKYPCSIITT